MLEPQPWQSYRSAVKKQGGAALADAAFPVKLDNILMRPEHFPEVLVHEVGFRLVQNMEVPGSAAGFNRPMYLFLKPWPKRA